jgi:hypothetical protein
MCGTIDPEHTYDEYLVLLAKSGITEVVLNRVNCRNASLDRRVLSLVLF